MFSFVKYIPALLKFKDVSEAYKTEQGKDKPFYLSGRFIGAVVMFLAAVIGVAIGFTLDQDILDQITKNLENLAVAAAALYGLARAIKGQYDASKRKLKAPAEGTGDGTSQG